MKSIKTKSKKDISNQISRIYNKFSEHRLYNRALSIALRYNWIMSETDTNKRLHSLYMSCYNCVTGALISGKENLSKRTLNEMENYQYPLSVYAKHN